MTSANAMKRLLTGSLLVVMGCVQRAPEATPLPKAPQLMNFEASPTRVKPEQEVALRWRVDNATQIELYDSNRGALANVTTEVAGEVKVRVSADTLFVLTARNERGVRVSKVVSVSVEGAESRNLLFSAFPAVLMPGEQGTLVWSAPGAREVSISDGRNAVDLGGQLEAGSVTVNPTGEQTTFTLRADGASQQVVMKRFPAVVAFAADKALSEAGEKVLLRWQTQDASKVTLSVDGRGDLRTLTTPAEVAQGSFEDTLPSLTPGARVSYALVAENSAGQQVRRTMVVVGKQPTVISATAPRYAKEGSTFTLSWRTANADRVALRANGATIYETLNGSQASSGSLQLSTPNADTVYSVVAMSSASGVETQRDLPLEVVGTVAISSFTATPGTSPGACAPVKLSWKAPSARRLSVVENGLITVASIEGKAAERGEATVYPNRANARYTLAADNTIDPPVTSNLAVQVTAPAGLAQRGGGTVFQDQSAVDLDWTDCAGGTAVSGTAYSDAALRSGSTGFEDISTTGTELEFADTDEGYTAFRPRGMETLLFGERRTGDWYAFTNGMVVAGPSSYLYGYYLPYFPYYYTSSAILPFYADLTMGSKGKVLWEQRGTQPNAYVIVQWQDMQVKNQPLSSLTFQVKVFQTGAINFEYKNLTLTSNTFAVATGASNTYDWNGGSKWTSGPFWNSVTAFSPYIQPPTNRPAISVVDSSYAINEWRAPGNAPASGANLPISAWVRVGTGVAEARLDRFVRRGAFGISEVMYAPNPAVTAGEWFEVRNVSNVPIDMGGLTIDFSSNGSSTHTIAGNLVVQPGSVVVLGQTRATADNDGVAVDYAYGAGFSLPDTGTGTLRLLRGTTVISAVTYSASSPGGVGRAVLVGGDQLIRDLNTTRLTVSCGADSTYGSRGQRGSPGRLSSCFGYIAEEISSSYFDISGTGTQATLSSPTSCTYYPASQVGFATVSLGSDTFPYFRTTATGVTLSANGWMYARQESQRNCGNYIWTYPWPSSYSSFYSPTGGVLAPFFNGYYTNLDYDPNDTGGIFYKRVAANEDRNNPSPHWIFQWKKIRFVYLYWPVQGPGGEANFQVKVFDDGNIEYHYGDMVDPYAEQQPSGSYPNLVKGADAVIWLESPYGHLSNFPSNSFALPYSVRDRIIEANQTAVRYRRAMP